MYKTPTIHNMPEFKEARKAFQGINSTPKKSLEKSKRRMAEKMKKGKDKEFHKYMMSNNGKRPSHGGKWSTDDIPR